MSFASRTPDRMDVPPTMTTLNDENIATPVEEGKVAEVRQKLLGRATTSGLVPAAVANGMLVVAINMDNEDAFFSDVAISSFHKICPLRVQDVSGI